MVTDHPPGIEVCFSPLLYPSFHKDDAVVVITDVLRASSAICTAFMNGVDRIIPVATVEEALDYKQRGYLVAAERDGIKIDFADFGNSPFNFTTERVKYQTVVYSTTNGTQAVHLASNSHAVIISSFLNLTATCNWLKKQKRDVIILCAGWKNKFSLEDTVHAGAIVGQLMQNPDFSTTCDSALAALDLWQLAKNDLRGYLEKAAQRTRLKKNNLDDVIDYCLTLDLTDIIPKFDENVLVKMSE
jgi:2-phosphosulfolactate phosphatase